MLLFVVHQRISNMIKNDKHVGFTKRKKYKMVVKVRRHIENMETWWFHQRLSRNKTTEHLKREERKVDRQEVPASWKQVDVCEKFLLKDWSLG